MSMFTVEHKTGKDMPHGMCKKVADIVAGGVSVLDNGSLSRILDKDKLMVVCMQSPGNRKSVYIQTDDALYSTTLVSNSVKVEKVDFDEHRRLETLPLESAYYLENKIPDSVPFECEIVIDEEFNLNVNVNDGVNVKLDVLVAVGEWMVHSGMVDDGHEVRLVFGMFGGDVVAVINIEHWWFVVKVDKHKTISFKKDTGHYQSIIRKMTDPTPVLKLRLLKEH